MGYDIQWKNNGKKLARQAGMDYHVPAMGEIQKNKYKKTKQYFDYDVDL